MTKMTANNDWIPFISLITKRNCDRNINYGDIVIKIPFVTHVLGHSLPMKYEFSDSTLTYLLNELLIWNSELKGERVKQERILTFSSNCLNEVTLNAFIHFVHHFPEKLFKPKFCVKWDNFYMEKKNKKLITYSKEENENE